jgi:hypothetical protein
MPDARARDLTIVAEMKTICDEFEAYGYRRVDAELRHRGIVVNAKKIRRRRSSRFFTCNLVRRQERVCRAQRPAAKIYAIATPAEGRDGTSRI